MVAELRRLAPYVWRYRWRYAVGAACVLVSVALRFLVPYLLGDSLDVLREAATGETNTSRLRELVAIAAVTMVGVAMVAAVIRTTSRLMILGNSRLAVHDVREDLFARLLVLAPSFYVRHRTGQIMSRAVNDMQNVQGLLGPVFMYLIETGVLFAVGIAFMTHADPLLAVVALAPFPFFLALARRLARRVQEGSRAAQEQLGELSAKVDESLSGYRVIKSLVLEDWDRKQFKERAEGYSRTVLGVAKTRATLSATMTFLAALSALLVLLVGAPRVAAGTATVGEIVSLVLYVGMLAAPTRTLGFVLSSLQRGAAALGRIGEILDMPPSIDDAEGAAGEVRHGAIEVRELSVGVLDRVSFAVPAGTTLGVVGPVGAGKTTLLRALARQLEIEPGQVFLDGTDATSIPLPELRRAVGMAPQDSFLFSDTLLENVRFGAPSASREAVEAAVEIAQLTRDLERLPDGLDTMLGERGVNLSGGQRQRASLARVALLSPAVLLLDDTLSAVDTETADAILERLRPLMAERTTVVVAHRLSTVRDADRIVVLEDGRVTESGTHEELLERGGYYASVWAAQAARAARADLAHELGLEEEV